MSLPGAACCLPAVSQRAVFLSRRRLSIFVPSLHRESCAAHHDTLNRLVPCPNAVRLTRARLLRHARSRARRTTRAPRLPLLRPSPCRRVRKSSAALARVVCARLQPALSRESPARIAASGLRSPTAFTLHPGAIEPASRHSSPHHGRALLCARIRPDERRSLGTLGAVQECRESRSASETILLGHANGPTFHCCPIARSARSHIIARQLKTASVARLQARSPSPNKLSSTRLSRH
jgi:hypothetical protein